MKPRRPKWSPGDLNGVQEAQMEARRPKWSPGDLNGAQEAQMETRRPKWNTRGPLSTQERASARNSDDPPYITPPR